jgi:transposase, IS5 family
MLPKEQKTQQMDLFRNFLENEINHDHPLCKIANEMNWSKFTQDFGKHYQQTQGRPALPIRLMVSLECLKHMYDQSDEETVSRWLENPYWQYFSGVEYFHTRFPADASSMVRFRKRIGEAGIQTIFAETIKLGLATQTIRPSSLKKVIVDTTVQEKNITYPTDGKSQNKIREYLVKFANKAGIKLRQNYAKLSPRSLIQGARYVHARQMKRAKKSFKRVTAYLGRVSRDLDKQWQQIKASQGTALKSEYQRLSEISKTLLEQVRTSKQKIYSVHESHVECISKGKARKPYEFGVKVSIGVTHKEGFVVDSQAIHGKPYDGHTLQQVLQSVEINTQVKPAVCFVDKGYRGHKVTNVDVYQSGQRKGMTKSLKKQLKRRSMIEPMIGHMKADGRLGINYLKGVEGDKINAILCGIGHNFRLISNQLAAV